MNPTALSGAPPRLKMGLFVDSCFRTKRHGSVVPPKPLPCGKPWENHGKTMGKPWENHGKTMGKWGFLWKTTVFLLGKSTISMAIFNSELFVDQSSCLLGKKPMNTIDIPPLNHSYWNYLHQLGYLEGTILYVS